MKKAGIIVSYILMLIGAVGFIGGGLVGMKFINYKNEVPLGGIHGFVVDKNGTIYIGLGAYGKVQVYDKNGKFIGNWDVRASGGAFHIDLTEDENILISTARGNRKILYDKEGKVMSINIIENIYTKAEKSWDSFTTQQGEEYEVKGWMFPKVVRISPDNKVIVKQGLFMHLLKAPLPSWLIAAIGVILLYFLAPDKRNKVEK